MTAAVLAADAARRQASAASVRRAVAAMLQRGEPDRRALIRMLSDMRARLVAELATAEDFDAQRARALLRSIDAESRRLRSEMLEPLTRSLSRSISEGDAQMLRQVQAVLEPDDFRQVPQFVAAVDVDLLDFARQNTVDLVGQISAKARADLSAIARRSATGSSSSADVARQIEDMLGREGRDVTRFGSLAVQVDRVHRTEIGRLYEGASKARQERLADAAPVEILKGWIATPGPRTRQSHWHLNGVYIPIGEHFNVGAGATWSKVSFEQAERDGGTLGQRADGPHDSALTAAEAVNCRCTRGTRHGKRKDGR